LVIKLSSLFKKLAMKTWLCFSFEHFSYKPGGKNEKCIKSSGAFGITAGLHCTQQVSNYSLKY